MEGFLSQYMSLHKQALDSIPLKEVEEIIALFKKAWEDGRRIFFFGNGGSGTNSSHFATDLGKGASDAMPKPFRCMSLNDNTPWMTALSNDYKYEEVFSRQLNNFAEPGDIIFALSVSGNSPNVVTAVEWGKRKGVYTIALVGANRGRAAALADKVIVIDSTHFGRVEDAHMAICHMICYAFIEKQVVI